MERSSVQSHIHRRKWLTICFGAATLGAPSVSNAQALSGRWDAVLTIGSLRVPFTMHFEGSDSSFTVFLVTGDTRIRSTTASFDGKTARADFQTSASRMQAVLSEGSLTGTFGNAATGEHRFKATAFCTCGFVGEAGPEIMGLWESPENNWKVAFRRVGEDTIATISQSGKDIGPLGGRFNGTFFELSLFNGARAAVLEVEPTKDGALDLCLMEPGSAVKKLKAVKAEK